MSAHMRAKGTPVASSFTCTGCGRLVSYGGSTWSEECPAPHGYLYGLPVDCRDTRNVHCAAPALLAALETLLSNNELGEFESQRQGKPSMIEARDKARAAIALAKGESK